MNILDFRGLYTLIKDQVLQEGLALNTELVTIDLDNMTVIAVDVSCGFIINRLLLVS